MKIANKHTALLLLPINRDGQKRLRAEIPMGMNHELTAFRVNRPGYPVICTLAPKGLMDDVETLLGLGECLGPYYRGDR